MPDIHHADIHAALHNVNSISGTQREKLKDIFTGGSKVGHVKGYEFEKMLKDFHKQEHGLNEFEFRAVKDELKSLIRPQMPERDLPDQAA